MKFGDKINKKTGQVESERHGVLSECPKCRIQTYYKSGELHPTCGTRLEEIGQQPLINNQSTTGDNL